jgi:hypothetical protein
LYIGLLSTNPGVASKSLSTLLPRCPIPICGIALLPSQFSVLPDPQPPCRAQCANWYISIVEAALMWVMSNRPHGDEHLRQFFDKWRLLLGREFKISVALLL